MTGGSRRNATIDVARGVAILLVVLGHNRIGPAATALLYTFHVHTFFLLTGATFSFEKYRDAFRPLAWNRFKRLVVPYLFSAPIFYLLWYFVGRRFGEDSGAAIPPSRPLLGILYANGTGDWMVFNVPLWFLPALFSASVLFWLALRAGEAWRPMLRSAFVVLLGVTGYLISRVVVLPWGVDLALVALVFMYAGHELRRSGRLSADGPPVPLVAAVLAALLLAAVVVANGHVDAAQRRYHSFPLFLLGGLSGGVVVLYASWLAARWRPAAALFTRLGSESLVILVFHLLGMQVLSAALLFGAGADPETMMVRFWWGYTAFAVAFSLAAGAVIRAVPPLRAIYYGDAPPGRKPRAVLAVGEPPARGGAGE